VVGHY